jgi:hypothetical protein
MRISENVMQRLTFVAAQFDRRSVSTQQVLYGAAAVTFHACTNFSPSTTACGSLLLAQNILEPQHHEALAATLALSVPPTPCATVICQDSLANVWCLLNKLQRYMRAAPGPYGTITSHAPCKRAAQPLQTRSRRRKVLIWSKKRRMRRRAAQITAVGFAAWT